jgi:hypothetical protein
LASRRLVIVLEMRPSNYCRGKLESKRYAREKICMLLQETAKNCEQQAVDGWWMAMPNSVCMANLMMGRATTSISETWIKMDRRLVRRLRESGSRTRGTCRTGQIVQEGQDDGRSDPRVPPSCESAPRKGGRTGWSALQILSTSSLENKSVG